MPLAYKWCPRLSGSGRPVGPTRNVSAKPVEIYGFGIIEGYCSPHFHRLDGHILSDAGTLTYSAVAKINACRIKANGSGQGITQTHGKDSVRNIPFSRADPSLHSLFTTRADPSLHSLHYTPFHFLFIRAFAFDRSGWTLTYFPRSCVSVPLSSRWVKGFSFPFSNKAPIVLGRSACSHNIPYEASQALQSIHQKRKYDDQQGQFDSKWCYSPN